MVAQIGRSTTASTATNRYDVAGSEPAPFRYNNPGAQYPSAEAARFGQIGYGIIGGDHKIACFSSPVNGAAANFDLLNRNYTSMAIGAAGTKWTGAHGFGVPGYDPDSILTKEILDEPIQAIALLKAIAARESGRGNNLTDEQWRQAHRMFKLGGADAYLDDLPKDDVIAKAPVGKKTGEGLVKLARIHIGEEYRNIQVPKDKADWKGPWDCAEFVSWLVFQEAGILYGCIDDEVKPSEADSYTGAWKADVERLGKRVSVDEAASTVGGILLRYPPAPGAMGHIAVCDGKGGTVEAKGRRYGVVADSVHGRSWDTGVLIPGIAYGAGAAVNVTQPATIYKIHGQNMDKGVVFRIQEALASKGFNPGIIDGDFGPDTQAAVSAFQMAEGLVVDGEVGSETAEALGVPLIAQEPRPDQRKPVTDWSEIISVIEALKRIIEQPSKDGGATMPASTSSPISLLEQVAKFLQTLRQQPGTSDTPPVADQQIEQLRKVIGLILPIINPGAVSDKAMSDKDAPLGQVNGALGQWIGHMLNGKKTGLGIIGALLTSLLSTPAAGNAIPALVNLIPGIGQFAMPISLALAAWGALGKMEKWAQGKVPMSQPPK